MRGLFTAVTACPSCSYLALRALWYLLCAACLPCCVLADPRLTRQFDSATTGKLGVDKTASRLPVLQPFGGVARTTPDGSNCRWRTGGSLQV